MISEPERIHEMITFIGKLNVRLVPMPGRKPIFASLITRLFWGTRDFLFRATLEPLSHEKRKKREEVKKAKEQKKKGH